MRFTSAMKPQRQQMQASPPTRHTPHKPTQKHDAGVSAGLPLFLQRAAVSSAGHVSTRHTGLKVNQPGDTFEQEADHIADTVMRSSDRDMPERAAVSTQVQREISPGSRSQPSAIGRAIEQRVHASRANGRPLPRDTRQAMEKQLGIGLGDVRVHTDAEAHQLARSLGANAFTTGRDIYFDHNKFEPGSREGDRLLAHELTHAVQQGGEASGQVQFDLMQTLPTALGGLEIEMATRTTPRVGMEGHIRFLPDPSGPYSAEIGLIQAVNVTDVGGTTASPGSPVDWSNVGAGAESGRMELMTTGTEGAPPGWFIDAQTATHARTSSVGPNYIEQWGITSPTSASRNYFGWLRSPTDWRETSLYDYPNASFDSDFEFETVAKATDTQTVYGALEWGFQIRSGAVQNEYVSPADIESSTFNEALERFRGYYTHEPVVFYFDTNMDVPIPGEETKITEVMDYLNRYPDVMIRIEGFADERGRIRHNEDLSERRALAIENLAISRGLDPTRIDYTVGWGETQEFAAGRTAGTWRANRRVVMSFFRTASTPIVMP